MIEIKQNDVLLFDEVLLGWADDNLRDFPWRKIDNSPYSKIVTELLLQRTKADSVAKIYYDFFDKYPDWQSLSDAREADLESLIKPLGLHKRRVATLKKLANAILMAGGNVPRHRKEIDNLPGVGQYIANAIEMLVFGRPAPLIDVNMARLLERFFGPRKLADIRYDPCLQALADKVIRESDKPTRMNFAILDYAAIVCKKNPNCQDCALKVRCNFYKSDLR